MGIAEALAKVTDPYERQARLWPALLAGLPLFALITLLYAPAINVGENLAMLAASCGGLYLLTNLCRDLGKRLESRLFESWGGKPTTQLLRHRDTTIEGVTKRRYHSFLAAKIGEPFPTKDEEAADPRAADELYQSAVRWLLNQTRDQSQFSLLLNENIAYGYRRNALGLKPIAILVAVGSLAWTLATQGVFTTNSATTFVNIESLVALPANALLSCGVSVVMLATWLFFFTKARVRNAAFTYAELLLRACDVLK